MKNKFLQQIIISLIALLTAVSPYLFKYIDSIRLGVTYNSVEFAKEQRVLWEKNIDCLLENKNKVSFKRIDNSTISMTVCKSGDILMDYCPIEGQRTTRWLSFNSIKSTGLSAQMRQQIILKTIKSVYQTDDNIIIIEKENNDCYEVYINKATGEIIKKTKISCEE